jgi:hypothetical protein
MNRNMNYILKECNNKEEWNKFVLSSPQNNLFCRTNFLDSLQQNCDFWFVQKGELILLGVLINKNSDSSPLDGPFMYQGILFSEYIESLPSHKKYKICLDSVEFLLKELEPKYKAFSLSLHHSLVDLRAFQWLNYHNKKGSQAYLELIYTGILEINENMNFDQILANTRSSRRQEYRRCIKNGFSTEESLDFELLDSLHDKTFLRQGLTRPLYDKYLSKVLAKESINKGFGRLLVCKDNQGKPASACLFLFDDNTCYYLIGANDPEFRKSGSGSFIVFQQIKYFLEKGFQFVDFIGINSPARGDFKLSFNSSPRPYYLFSMK